jgi:hypothetical protein
VNTGKLDQLLDNQSGIQREIHYIRTDVTDIHGAITELRRADHDTADRVTRLERHARFRHRSAERPVGGLSDGRLRR